MRRGVRAGRRVLAPLTALFFVSIPAMSCQVFCLTRRSVRPATNSLRSVKRRLCRREWPVIQLVSGDIGDIMRNIFRHPAVSVWR
nr:MAG TPA: hypothetical protein [Caudoviricetes sp.]